MSTMEEESEAPRIEQTNDDAAATNDEESPISEEEEATDTIHDGQHAPEIGQMSVFGCSLPTDQLPVAHEVESTIAPAPQRVVQPQDPTIPHAIPQEQILQEERRAARRRVLFVSAWVLSLIVVVVVVFIVIFGGGSSSSSDGRSGEDEATEPTPSPTTAAFQELQELISSVSFDNGTSLQDTDLPQYKALTWLEGNKNLDDYEEWKRIQRYALATVYYATNGNEWHQHNGWLSDDDECTWYYTEAVKNNVPILDVCNEHGAYVTFRVEKNNMNGTLPSELALLSDTLSGWLDLDWNLLHGTIPTEILLLTNLELLAISDNRLTGTIPTEFAMIGGKNRIPGSLDVGIRIGLEGNLLTGTIPTEILGIEGLEWLTLGGNLLTGSIPTEIGLASNLSRLALQINELTGSLPTELGQLSLLEWLLFTP